MDDIFEPRPQQHFISVATDSELNIFEPLPQQHFVPLTRVLQHDDHADARRLVNRVQRVNGIWSAASGRLDDADVGREIEETGRVDSGVGFVAGN
jgi:hypothetical protein